MRMRTLERKKSNAGRLTAGHPVTQPGPGQDQTEFDDLISALRTGDVFGENIDKFKRNRKSRTSPPRVERMESFLRERSKERILNWAARLLRKSTSPEIGPTIKHRRRALLEIFRIPPLPLMRVALVGSSLWYPPFFPTFLPTAAVLPLSLSYKKWKWQCCRDDHKHGLRDLGERSGCYIRPVP